MLLHSQSIQDLFRTAALVLTSITATRMIHDLKTDMELHVSQSARAGVRARARLSQQLATHGSSNDDNRLFLQFGAGSSFGSSTAFSEQQQPAHLFSAEEADLHLIMMSPFVRRSAGKGMPAEGIYTGVHLEKASKQQQHKQHTSRPRSAIVLRSSVIAAARKVVQHPQAAATSPPLPVSPAVAAAVSRHEEANSSMTLHPRTSESSTRAGAADKPAENAKQEEEDEEDEFSRYIEDLPEDYYKEPNWRRGHEPVSNNIDWSEALVGAAQEEEGEDVRKGD
jgi:hypothetical protein